MANDYSGNLKNDISLLKKRNAELEASAEHTKRYGYEVGQNQKRIEVYNKKIDEIRKNEEKINNLTADRIGLGKQINNLTMNKLKLNIDIIILAMSITTIITVITYNIITNGIINYISFNGI